MSKNNEYGTMAIYCKDCGGMFYASTLDPIVIAYDAKNITKYEKQGHVIANVSIDEVKEKFYKISCVTCRPSGTK